MKVQELEHLTEAEQALVFKAPALVTLLIAGADGNIDEDEEKWAASVVNYRRVTGEEDLFTYYEAVEDGFVEQFKAMVADYPQGQQERILKITEELEGLNAILPKIGTNYALLLVKSWKSLAKQVAKASGGILGFGSISQQEKQFMELDMIKFG